MGALFVAVAEVLVVIAIGLLSLKRVEVVLDHAFGQFKVVFYDELVDQLAAQALLGHVFPALLDLSAEMLAQVVEGLELFAEVFGELIVEFGQRALAHFVGCHCKMRGLAGELFVR